MDGRTYVSDIKPFRLYKNLYFVGSTQVSVHLLDTAKGIVIIDTGYPSMYEQILDSIRYLGFDPMKIAHIFHSHGHYDHIGATVRLKNISGAKTYISKEDNDIVNGTLDLSWANEFGVPHLEYFDCDILVEDGELFDFGDTKIRCRLTPGHTPGVLSFFITFDDGKVAAMHGGIGMNGLRGDILKKYNLPFELRDIFRRDLHLLADERVDLVIGNHPEQSGTVKKQEALLRGENILLGEYEWPRLLKTVEEDLDNLIKREAGSAL
jgi:metallo-beta-lactamase class B